MIDLYQLILYPILYIFPAYVANGAPVIFGGGTPIDFGMKIGGKRVFGDHKTVKGLVSGICAGIIVGWAESLYFSMPYLFIVAIALSIGTHFGDLFGSFVKRRMNARPGSSVAFLDQYTFLIFALIFAYPLGNFPNLYGILFLLIITGILHKLTNVGAHMLKLKSVAW